MNFRYKVLKICIFCVLLNTLVPMQVFGQETETSTEDIQLLRQLENAVEQKNEKEIEALASQLTMLGDKAALSIKNSLSTQERLRAVYLRVLGSIPGDTSTDALLKLAAQNADRDLSILSIYRLENRTIPRALTANELQALVVHVQRDNVSHAGMASRVLAASEMNDTVDRVKPIMARFKRAIETPLDTKVEPGSYLSQEVLALNQFLLAISKFNDTQGLTLIRQELTPQTSAKMRIWLVIALGMAGDESSLVGLQKIVKTTGDLSTKAAALRAYSAAGKENAIPFLESFLQDETSIGRDRMGEIYPLRIVAKDELFKLRSTDK